MRGARAEPRGGLIVTAYLASHGFSMLGNSIVTIVLPIVVLQQLGSPLAAGAVAAGSALPGFFAGLLLGVVIDRLNRRGCAIAADLISACSVAALPLVDAFWGLNLGWFLVLGIIGALGDVPGITAREALLPAVVRAGGVRAERLAALRESTGAAATLVGPAMAGLLLSSLEASAVLWVTAATSFVAALITLAVPHRLGRVGPEAVPPPGLAVAAPGRAAWQQMRRGWTEVVRDRFIRDLTIVTVVLMFVLAGLQGLVLPVHFTAAGHPETTGYVLASFAAGTLGGGGIFALAGRRGPRRAWLSAGLILSVAGVVLIGALPEMPLLFAGAVTLGVSTGLLGSLVGVLMIERVPEAMRGRIFGTQNALLAAAPPLGIGLAAVLMEMDTSLPVGLTLAFLWVVVAPLALFSPSLKGLDGPMPRQDRTTVG